jgi:hypothetical protein
MTHLKGFKLYFLLNPVIYSIDCFLLQKQDKPYCYKSDFYLADLDHFSAIDGLKINPNTEEF